MGYTNYLGIESCYNTRVIDYVQLLKPRVIFLVIFTAIIGMLIVPVPINPLLFCVALLCISVGSGGAAAINMWYDSDVDAIMERTKSRPIPSGRVSKENALEFGVVLSLISVFTMAWSINYISAALLAVAILFYSVVYTIFLKRYTYNNIVIGGSAGALVPIIGWSAMTGSLSIEPVILFFIIFMWTPPHFWALSLLNVDEYKKCKIPMLPVVKGIAETRKFILIYSSLLVPTTLLMCLLQLSGCIYNVAAITLGLIFLYLAYAVYRKDCHPYKLFKFSILYLFLIFIFIFLDKLYAL